MDKQGSIFFAGRLKKEEIIIGGKLHVLPPCSIMKLILETEDWFWDAVESISAEILFMCEIDCQMFSSDDVIQSLVKAKSIVDLSGPKILKELMLLLPACMGYTEARRKEKLVELSDLEFAEFKYMIFDSPSKEERGTAGELFLQRRNDMGSLPAITSRWYRWFNYLVSDDIPSDLEYELNVWQDCPQMLNIAEQYSQNLHNICTEAKKLKPYIEIALGMKCSEYLNKTKAIDWLMYGAESPMPLTSGDASTLFKSEFVKDKQAYALSALSALISLEMKLYLDHQLTFKRCEFCGGLFASGASKVKYCDYPNSSYEGKTCKEVAPEVVRLMRSDLMAEYDKKRSAYKKWVKRTIEKDERKMYDYMIALQKNAEYIFGKGKGQLFMKRVEEEVNSGYLSWKKNAKDMLQKYEEGKITKEECRAALTLPPLKERSALLAKWEEGSLTISSADLNI